MAKQTLPVNYQDDIVSESMNGRRRYNMIQNPDGTFSFVDATEYEQLGSNFGAGQINAMSQAINESADASKVIQSLKDIGAVTEKGFIAGALPLKEVKQTFISNIYVGTDGKLHKVQGGADSVLPFNNSIPFRWRIVTTNGEFLNLKNTGKLKIKTLAHDGGANNVIIIYGTNDPTILTNINVTRLTDCTVTSNLDVTLDTGNDYEYIVLYNLYQTVGTHRATVEISQ